MSRRASEYRVYQVTEPDWERSSIVVARNPMEARRLGAGELGFEERFLEVELAPELEGYAGDDLIRRQLETGWWFGCHRRGCTKDVRHDDGEGAPPNRYVIRDGDVFCSSECAIQALRRERWALAWKWNAVSEAVLRYPGIKIFEVYENVAGDGVYEVEFPGEDHRSVRTLEGCP